MSTEHEAEGKLDHFEGFLESRLKRDLVLVSEQRSWLLEEIHEYETLKACTERLKETGLTSNVEARVDLGCNFFVNAEM